MIRLVSLFSGIPLTRTSYWYSSIFFDRDTFSTFCIPFLADSLMGGIFVMKVCKSLVMELSFRVCLASSSTALVCGSQESQNQRQFDILPSTLMSSEERDTQAPWNHLLHSSHMIKGSTCSANSSSLLPHLECFALSSETIAFARFGGIERSEVDLLNNRSYLISLSQQLVQIRVCMEVVHKFWHPVKETVGRSCLLDFRQMEHRLFR